MVIESRRLGLALGFLSFALLVSSCDDGDDGNALAQTAGDSPDASSGAESETEMGDTDEVTDTDPGLPDEEQTDPPDEPPDPESMTDEELPTATDGDEETPVEPIDAGAVDEGEPPDVARADAAVQGATPDASSGASADGGSMGDGDPTIAVPRTVTCDGELTEEECAQCDEASQAARDAYARYWEEQADDPCTTDADCELIPSSSWCFGGCPIAVRGGAGWLEMLTLAEEFCEAGESDCPYGDPVCGSAEAKCEAGQCVTVFSELTEPCAERTGNECEADGQCVLARGHQFNQTDECFGGAGQELACVDAAAECAGGQVGVNDAGRCWFFPDSCRPEGYRAPEADECGPVDPASCESDSCSSRSLADCEADEACRTVIAEPYDASRHCYGPAQPVSCEPQLSVAGVCLGVTVPAESQAGRCYIAGSACSIPSGLEQAEEEDCPEMISCWQ